MERPPVGTPVRAPTLSGNHAHRDAGTREGPDEECSTLSVNHTTSVGCEAEVADCLGLVEHPTACASRKVEHPDLCERCLGCGWMQESQVPPIRRPIQDGI